MRALLRGLVTFAAFGLSSTIQPGAFAGCSNDVADRFQFGEEQLVELLDEANVASPFELRQGDRRYRIELEMIQRQGEDVEDWSARRPQRVVFGARASACGNRSFMQQAAACVTQTGMPLLGRFTLYRLEPGGATAVITDRELSGELRVIGTALDNGHIALRDATEGTRIELHSRDGRRFELAHFHTEIDGMLSVF